jgi:single-strand DNA-binding protein
MARDLNQVIIIGRLTRDPEIKYTSTGTPVTKFSIANNASYTQSNEKKEIVNFFDINVWGNQAESCSKYLKKGSQVAIDGHLRQNRWVDQATGKNVSKVEIVANSVQFLSPSQRNEGQTQGQNQNQTYTPVNQNTTNNNTPKDFIPNPWNDNSGNGGNIDDPFLPAEDKDDDIPF